MFLLIIAILIDFIASLGKLLLFTFLGCVAVLANGVLAVIFNQEVLRMQDIVGASFAIVGGFLIIQFSKQTDVIMNASQIVHHLGGWQFIIYVFVEVKLVWVTVYLKFYLFCTVKLFLNYFGFCNEYFSFSSCLNF